jgi:hypothetical protein
MNRNLILIFLLFISEIKFISGQNMYEKEDSKGSLEIVCPELMNTILFKNKNMVGKPMEISGLRIQVYSTTNRYMANRQKGIITNAYSQVPCYLVYESPEFKIRIGDFRNKMEASPYLFLIKKDFESAFLVPSKIKFPPLTK